MKDVPWFPSIGDGAAANLGSGCISRDKLALTLGTSTALRVVLSDDISVIPEGLWCYRVDHNDSLLGAAMSEGGSVFDWLQSILRLEEISQLEADLRAMPPDAHGLTFLPLISGERSPGWVAEARGAILGLSQATKPADIVRAALEGVAIRILLVYELLRAALPDQPRIIASGGAIQHSLAWAQIIADALGQTITLSGNPEASARGVAMLGFRSLGIAADLQEFPFLTGRSFQPDMRHYEIYQAAFERQQVLYNHVIENLQSSNPKKNNYC